MFEHLEPNILAIDIKQKRSAGNLSKAKVGGKTATYTKLRTVETLRLLAYVLLFILSPTHSFHHIIPTFLVTGFFTKVNIIPWIVTN